MARNFALDVAQRKERKGERLKKTQIVASSIKRPAKIDYRFFRGRPRQNDIVRTYIIVFDRNMDPDMIYEKMNAVIPGVKVNADNVLHYFFIILLPKPLTIREVMSMTNRALEELI